MPIERQNSATLCEITPFFYLILLTFHLSRRGSFRSEAPSTVGAISGSHYLLVGRTDAGLGWCGQRGVGRLGLTVYLYQKRADWGTRVPLLI